MADIDLKELPRKKAKTKQEATLTANKTPVGLEKQLRKLLRFMVRETRKRFENQVLKAMTKETVGKFQDAQRGNFGVIYNELASKFEKSIDKQFNNKRIDKFVKKLYKNTGKMNKKVFDQSVNNTLGIDLENILKTDGLGEFTNASSLQTASQLQNVRDDVVKTMKQNVFRMMNEGASLNELFEQVKDITGKALKRGDLNARNELKNFNSLLSRKRAESVGITEGIWQTAKDERVRPSHMDRDGKKFELKKGLFSSVDGKTIQPGEEINCRCVFIPVVDLE